MLQFMGSQRVGHNWATELNWTELIQIYLEKNAFKRLDIEIILEAQKKIAEMDTKYM